ncbi:MAG: hypothetical protein JKY65_20310 [Planctomycetes bacterium]|nr:hypothetical protein [Planctomycetota bacterium]
MRHVPLCSTLCLSALAAWAPTAWAQEEPDLPEVRRVYEAQREAAQATGKALRSLEAFGRESRTPLSPAQARRRALARINGVRPQRRRRQRVDPEQAQTEFEGFRDAILSRLRELDPKRYPEPRDPLPTRTRTKLAVYDLADLVAAAPDHVAPTVGLAIGCGVALDMGGGEIAQPVIEIDMLIELIESELESADSTGNHSLEISGTRMVVRHSRAGHAVIQSVLKRLREARRGQLLVELRFYRLPRDVFAQVANHASNLLEEDERLLAKAVESKRATLLSTHQVVANDGQRVVVRQGGSRAIVGDLEVNQTGVTPVLNPSVRNVNEGLVLELRGLADRSQGVIHLDLALTRAHLTTGGTVRKIAGVEVELPELTITRTAASLIVPIGRGAFLAGSFATGSDEDAVVVYTRVRLTKGSK